MARRAAAHARDFAPRSGKRAFRPVRRACWRGLRQYLQTIYACRRKTIPRDRRRRAACGVRAGRGRIARRRYGGVRQGEGQLLGQSARRGTYPCGHGRRSQPSRGCGQLCSAPSGRRAAVHRADRRAFVGERHRVRGVCGNGDRGVETDARDNGRSVVCRPRSCARLPRAGRERHGRDRNILCGRQGDACLRRVRDGGRGERAEISGREVLVAVCGGRRDACICAFVEQRRA